MIYQPFIYPELPDSPFFPDDFFNESLVNELHPDNWKNPNPAKCYNLVIIGAGPAGLRAATDAARLGAKVAIIERSLIGGVSLNVGCIPSKTLARAGRLCSDIRRSWAYGIKGNVDLKNFRPDFPTLMERVRKVRTRVARQSFTYGLRDQGIDVFFGSAVFRNEDTIVVEGQNLHFKKALVASGGRPKTPNIPGLNESGFLTNETIFNLKTLPKSLLVIGGGPLGCEFGQAFQRLGCKVTIVEQTPLFLPKEERDAAQLLSDSFARDGMQIHLNTDILNIKRLENEKVVVLRNQNVTETVRVDEILTGIGRSPNVEGLGLEAAGIHFNLENGIEVNDFLQTSNRRVFASGDITCGYNYTQVARASAHIVVLNSLFGRRLRFSSLNIPWCTYTDPEVAHVGVYVRQERAKGIQIKSYTIPMNQVDRSIADGEEEGFVKIHVKEGTDKILGGTIVARHAGEMINEVTLAMVHGLRLRNLEKVIHSYPTQAAAIHQAADAYARERLAPSIKKLCSLWLRLNRY